MQAPPNSLLSSQGEVREVYYSADRLALSVDRADDRCIIELYRGTPVESVPKYLDKHVDFFGVFCADFNADSARQYKVRVMEESQVHVSEPSLTETQSSTPGTVCEGDVVYCDHRSRFAVSVQGRVRVFRSHFSPQLYVGTFVRVLGSDENNPQGEQCKAIYWKGERPLPEPKLIRARSLYADSALPTRVTLKAVVESVRKWDQELSLWVNCEGVRLRCLIPKYNPDHSLRFDQNTREEGIASGDTIRITGAVLNAPVAEDDLAANFELFCASSADLAILRKARPWTRTQLLTLVGSIAGFMLVSIIGNWWLKRTVDARTSQLSVVSQRLQAAFESMQEALLETSIDGRLAGCNSRFVVLFGFEPQKGEFIDRIIEQISPLIDDPSVLIELRRSGVETGFW